MLFVEEWQTRHFSVLIVSNPTSRPLFSRSMHLCLIASECQDDSQAYLNELPPEFFDDPEGYMDRKAAAQAKIAVEQAMATVMPYIQRTQSTDVVEKVAKGLSPEAQEFARKLASQMAPGQKLEGDALDLVQRATRDFDREHKEKVSRTVEPAIAEVQTVRMSPDMMDSFKAHNELRARHGLKPDSAAAFKKWMES